MAGAAVSNDGDTVGSCQVPADDQVSVYLQNIGVGQSQADKFLVGDGLGGVDKLFHFHTGCLLIIQILCYTQALASPWKKQAMDMAPASGVPMVFSP